MDKRYYSLDVFRGATVALMILVNNPGSWSHIYGPLEHAPWHGCTPTDLVFPFFLFAVGNAMSFVMPGFEAKGTSFFLQKVLKRTALIFLIGLLLNWSPFVKWSNDELVFKTWENLRILGVLQRIALCYCAASFLVFFLKTRGAFVASAVLLLGYWFLTLVFAKTADPFSLEGFWGTHVDRYLLGSNHIYKGEGVPFDPEGLISTLPAIVQVVFGFFVGQYIQQKGKNYEMLSQLFVAAIVLMVGGYLWDMSFPINKKLWSSSYVLYTSGLAIATLGICIYWIEFQGKRGAFTRFFDVFGKNPLFIFVLSGLLPRLVALLRIPNGINTETGKQAYTSAFGWLYEYVCKPISADLRNGSLLYALILIAFYWAICFWMDKKKIYVKV